MAMPILINSSNMQTLIYTRRGRNNSYILLVSSIYLVASDPSKKRFVAIVGANSMNMIVGIQHFPGITFLFDFDKP